jgi:hypothetical protein
MHALFGDIDTGHLCRAAAQEKIREPSGGTTYVQNIQTPDIPGFNQVKRL